MKILKICGLFQDENINEIANLQPDFMGFIFYEKSKSSHAGEFHPYVLTEPCLKVSLHTALHSIKSRKYNYIYGYTNNQCKNKLGFSLCFVLRYLTDAFLYNPFSHFTHFSSLALSCRHTF